MRNEIYCLCVYWWQFLSESLDVIQDDNWVISLGNAFTRQYALYTPDDEHSALLHRYHWFLLLSFAFLISEKLNKFCHLPFLLGYMCAKLVQFFFFCSCLGMLLQKVNERSYVRGKMDWMYMQANITVPTNRLGLAKAMGLVDFGFLWLFFFFYFFPCLWFMRLMIVITFRLRQPIWIPCWKSSKKYWIMLVKVYFIGLS